MSDIFDHAFDAFESLLDEEGPIELLKGTLKPHEKHFDIREDRDMSASNNWGATVIPKRITNE